MSHRLWPFIAATFLSAGFTPASAIPLPLAPSSWTIGPIIQGGNRSVGVVPMPRPAAIPDGWKFQFPSPRGKVGYITSPRTLSIAGKTLRMCFDIVGPGTFKATDGSEAKVRLYFQRRGDNWTAAGSYQDYRWWSTTGFAVLEVKNGVCISSVVNTSNWSQALGKPASMRMTEFNTAVLNVGVVGFTFGGTFYGHGVYAATGTPKFILREFSID